MGSGLGTLCVAAAVLLAQAGPGDTDAARDWLRRRVVPLSPQAAAGPDDLAPVADIIGDARVVGLGFAAPGAREPFEIGRRLLAELVERRGFTVVALATSLPDCQALNEYILHGTGDPEAALHAQGYWTWDNESVLGVVGWMRTYNADAAHAAKLRLYGLDMQNAGPALDGAVGYLRAFDQEAADELAARLEVLRGLEIFRAYPQWPDRQRDDLAEAAERLGATLDAGRDAMVADSPPGAWELARRNALIVRQNAGWVRAHFVRAEGDESVPSVRGRAMAANARWILDREGPDARMLVWAHNADVSRLPVGDAADAETTLGRELSASLGDGYRAIAVTFGGGAMQAIHVPIAWDPDFVQRLQAHPLADPEPDQLESMLASLAQPRLVLDLRAAPGEQTVRGWIDQSHPMWFFGSGYSLQRAQRGDYAVPVVAGRLFDAIVFVDSVTPARPNPRTRQRFDAPVP